MKNKGFTLIELLAVITILVILAIVVTPLVQKQLTDAGNTIYESQIENIKSAAKNWAMDHPDQIPGSDTDSPCVITLSTLQDGGYISEDLRDTKTKEKIDGSLTITITYQNNQYTYEVGE